MQPIRCKLASNSMISSLFVATISRCRAEKYTALAKLGIPSVATANDDCSATSSLADRAGSEETIEIAGAGIKLPSIWEPDANPDFETCFCCSKSVFESNAAPFAGNGDALVDEIAFFESLSRRSECRASRNDRIPDCHIVTCVAS